MHARNLKIVIVSGDRADLRRVNRFLTAFGYEVLSAVDAEQASAAMQTGTVDFLILDDRLQPGGVELCRCLHNSADRPAFTFLWTQLSESCQVPPRQITAALAAGIDDFLTRPLVYGEWLARLRAGARALEQRRRCGEQAVIEPVSGLPSRSSLRRKLDHQIDESRTSGRPFACGILDIDFFRRLKLNHGRCEAAQLLGQVAQRLGELVRPSDTAACFGQDRFAVSLDCSTEQDAIAEMNRICRSLADDQYSVEELKVAITVSAGVAVWQGDASAVDDLIHRAEQALDLAKRSGRDCVVCDDQFSETKSWHELAGRLFETTKARDVMTPCPVTLQRDDPFHKATALFEQTELLAIPVVDDSGKLAGVVWRESFINGSDVHETYPASHLHGRLADQLDEGIPSVAEETRFAQLVEQLSDDSAPLLVVVSDAQRPTGLLTGPGLASLSQPLASDSFRQDKRYQDTPLYLAVAES